MSMKVDGAVTIRFLETSSSDVAWTYVDYRSYTGYIRRDLIGG